MKKGALILITKNNTRGPCKKPKAIQLSSEAKKIILIVRNLGTKPQQEDHTFALAEEEEHPWLVNLSHGLQPQ